MVRFFQRGKEVITTFKSCTKRYADESDEAAFRFVFYCDQCASEFRPPPIPFGGAGKEQWTAEHGSAFARADYEAGYYFYSCPACGEHVCADCIENIRRDGEAVRSVCRKCYRANDGNRVRPHLQMIWGAEASRPLEAVRKTTGKVRKGGQSRWAKKHGSQV
ncbi:MAG: hypothetical protein LBT21_06650 [Oscillospiraceae bacterium]|jgi:hypothetical protein|nr:hypothetical protein [Oscillospiraceae bacterium]